MREISLDVSLPPEVQAGDYGVFVRALNGKGGVITSRKVTVTVEPGPAQEIRLSTNTPKIRTTRGQKVEFSIDVKNRGSSKTIDYKVQVPGGWKNSITPRFGNKKIRSQSFRSGEEKNIELSVTVPQTASPGTYPVKLKGSSGTAQDTLELSVRVPGTYELGIYRGEKKKNIKIQNEQEGTVQIVAETVVPLSVKNEGSSGLENIQFKTGWGLPDEWKTDFDPDQISKLQPGEIKKVFLTVKPPQDADQGDQSFEVTAIANKPYRRKASVDLTVSAYPGTYKLGITTRRGRKSIQIERGTEDTVQIAIKNMGNAPLGDIHFRSGWALPKGWKTEFKPDQISKLQPGETKKVFLMVKPPQDAVPGDYSFDVTAASEKTAITTKICSSNPSKEKTT
ncbi:hypothetical protein AKJ65_02310 [candidate division MSBL1 archaeon SCGC-AAA259E19]|uniref:Alpha-galactosidase NEW3 domain-containing protein n=1 Tax=candidate division MSBL1 archaeon SCGC-AAA259E19 TaxID=1698264 RepID=A0A133ULU5_9EURY|nr:hypothetical protein AKJ65_02310 [candidate division MSBL1 archaeon SCGC-AAA259E19]